MTMENKAKSDDNDFWSCDFFCAEKNTAHLSRGHKSFSTKLLLATKKQSHIVITSRGHISAHFSQ